MLVAIEGIDGAGKRTQTQLLKLRMESVGRTVCALSFPRYGETFMAGAIADYLNGQYGDLNATPPQFPALLYAGDRFESRTLLLDCLRACDVVLIDRYVASNAAYQASKLEPEERPAFIQWLDLLEYGVYGLPQADMTLLLDVPTSVASALVAKKDPRCYTDAAADLHERNTQFLERCRAVYEELMQSQHRSRWQRVACTTPDGSLRSIETIHESVWNAVGPSLRAADTEAT